MFFGERIVTFCDFCIYIAQSVINKIQKNEKVIVFNHLCHNGFRMRNGKLRFK